MSVPTTLNALIVVALVFIPGIIFGQLIRRSIAHFPETVDARHFLTMGASGLFLHTLAFPLGTRWIWGWYRDGTLDDHVLATYVWFLLVVFVWPVVAGIALSKLVEATWFDRQLDRVGMSYVDRTPTAWDYAVRDERTSWVRVHLKDGKTTLVGWFGTNSFASLYSPRKDIYLEQLWFLDDNDTIAAMHVNTDGVWINHDVISHIVFQIGQEHGETKQIGDQGDVHPL